VRLAEGNVPVDRLGGARDDEQCVAILLDLWMLMSLAGILDGQVMQVELRLHPSQQISAWLEKADPDDVAGSLRPLASVFDRDILDPTSAAVDARGNDPGFGPPMSRNGLVSWGVHGFSIPPPLADYSIIHHSCRSVDRFTL
jgi:hypothetical protein